MHRPKAVNFISVTIAVLSCIVFLKSNLLRSEGADASVPNSYKVVLEALLPLTMVDEARFWDDLEWAFSVRILPRRDLAPEVQFTLYKSYEKRILMDFVLPKEGTIQKQLEDLKLQDPNEKFEEIIRKISIERGSLSQDDFPVLIA